MAPTKRSGLYNLLVWSDMGVGDADEADGEDLSSLLGVEGVADTNLRPSGIGRFDGEFIDVLSNRGFIAKGAKVVIVKVRGKVVTVKEVEGEI